MFTIFVSRISIYCYVTFYNFLLLKDFQAWRISLNIIELLQFLVIQKSQGLAGVIFVVPGGSCSYSWYLIPWMLDDLSLCPGNFILKNYFKFEAADEGSFFQVSGHTTYLGSPQSQFKDSVSLDRPGHVNPDHKQGCRLFYFSITLIQSAVSVSWGDGSPIWPLNFGQLVDFDFWASHLTRFSKLKFIWWNWQMP